MRVYLDLQAVQSVAHPERGIARYVMEHAAAMVRQRAPITRMALNPSLPRPTHLPEVLRSAPNLVWGTTRELRAARREGPTAYHLMSPFEHSRTPDGAVPPAALEADALVVTVYDLIPLLFPERYLSNHHVRTQYEARLELVRRADLVCAISEHTRMDVIKLLGVPPQRCVAIGTGASDLGPDLSPQQAAEEVRSRCPSIVRPFVFTVAGWEWRKNVDALIRSYALLPEEIRGSRQLVITCALPPDGLAAWSAEVERAGLAPGDVIFTGRVDNTLLQALYRTCELFVYPSIYEGFGLPVLEAARCGAAAITSASSSLPEILEWEPSCFDPSSDDDIAAVMHRGLVDEHFRRELRVAGARAAEVHSWSRVADRTAAAYRELTPGASPRKRSEARVAFVGPLPPSRSGVATFTDRIVRHLPRSWELTFFYEGDRPHADPARSVFPVRQLGRLFSPTSFDAIVFVLGNSTFHEETIELARRIPGIVWLHDIDLSGIARYRAGRAGPADDADDALRQMLLESYGEVPLGLGGPRLVDAMGDRSAMLRFAGRAVVSAEHIIVNSHQAASLLRLDVGNRPLPLVSVVPLPIPSAAEQGLHSEVTRSPQPTIVSLGIVDDIKRPSDLLAAVAALPDAPHVRFVGECEPALEARLLAEADSLGLRDRVQITGWLPPEEYAAAAAAGWIAVQLRRTSNGESSGAVVDAVGLGLPVLTTIPSGAEVPGDAVTCLPVDASVEDIAAALRDLLVTDLEAARRSVRSAARHWRAEDAADRVAAVICATAGVRR